MTPKPKLSTPRMITPTVNRDDRLVPPEGIGGLLYVGNCGPYTCGSGLGGGASQRPEHDEYVMASPHPCRVFSFAMLAPSSGSVHPSAVIASPPRRGGAAGRGPAGPASTLPPP